MPAAAGGVAPDLLPVALLRELGAGDGDGEHSAADTWQGLGDLPSADTWQGLGDLPSALAATSQWCPPEIILL